MKRLLGLFLTITALMTNLFSSPLFAMESSTTIDKHKDLITIVEEIQAEKTQTYSTDSSSTIEIIENSDKYQIVKFSENDKENILMYDITADQLYADGHKISVLDIVVPDNQVFPYKLMSSFDHQYKSVQLEQQIIRFTSDALGAIIAWSLAAPTPLAIYIASEYINKALSSGYGHSKACYAFMFKAMDDSYTFYVQYWSMYWDSGYYYHLETFTQTIYQ